MDPISILAMATLGTAILVQGSAWQQPVRMPRWVYDGLWEIYISWRKSPTEQELVRQDFLQTQERLPMTLLPPDIGSMEVDDLLDALDHDHVIYFLTQGDLAFIRFLQGRYELGDVLTSALRTIEDPDDPDQVLHVLHLCWSVRLDISRILFLEDGAATTGNQIQFLLDVIGPMSEEDYLALQMDDADAEEIASR